MAVVKACFQSTKICTATYETHNEQNTYDVSRNGCILLFRRFVIPNPNPIPNPTHNPNAISNPKPKP